MLPDPPPPFLYIRTAILIASSVRVSWPSAACSNVPEGPSSAKRYATAHQSSDRANEQAHVAVAIGGDGGGGGGGGGGDQSAAERPAL